MILYSRTIWRRWLLYAIVISSSCLCDIAYAGEGAADYSGLIKWLLLHPERVQSVANGVAGSDKNSLLQLPADVRTALDKDIAANGAQATLVAIVTAAKEADSILLASLFENLRVLAVSKEQPPHDVAPLQLADRRWQLFRAAASVPKDQLLEVSLPYQGYTVKTISLDSGLAWADYLIQEVATPAPDRANAAAWLDRVAWVVGSTSPQHIPNKATCSLEGTLHLNGYPLPLTRVLVAEYSTDSKRSTSFLRGLDVFQAIDVVKIPGAYASGMTDAMGKFRIRVPAGGPYRILFFPTQRATTPIKTVSVRVQNKAYAQLDRVGLSITDEDTRHDIGVIDIQVQYRNRVGWPALAVLSAPLRRLYVPGDRITVPVRVGNAGNKPLVISGAKTDCACSKLMSPIAGANAAAPVEFPVTIPPGQSLLWSMVIDIPAGETVGSRTKRFILLSDDPINPATEHRVAYGIDEPLRSNPPVVRLYIGEQPSAQIVRLVGHEDAAISRVLSGELKGIRAEVVDSRSVRISADSRVLNTADTVIGSAVTVSFEGDKYPPLNIPIQCYRNDKSIVTPRAYAFGRVRTAMRLVRQIKIKSDTFGDVSAVSTSGTGATLEHTTAQQGRVEFEIVVNGPCKQFTIVIKSTTGKVAEVPITWSVQE